MRIPTFALSILVLSASGAMADVYSWRDADGKMQYSDQPPPGSAQAVKRRATPAPAASAPGSPQGTAPKSHAEQELEFRKRRAERIEAEAKATEEATRKAELARECKIASQNLEALKSGQRAIRFNAAGDREVLDDAGRAAEIRRIEKNMANTCK